MGGGESCCHLEEVPEYASPRMAERLMLRFVVPAQEPRVSLSSKSGGLSLRSLEGSSLVLLSHLLILVYFL